MANYFRVCGIPYELRHMQFPRDDKIRKREVGVTQMSNVELADGSVTIMDRICRLPADKKIPRKRGRRYEVS